jgi:hypothetical protein
VTLLAKYTNGPLKLYAGYEWIQFTPPSDRQTALPILQEIFSALTVPPSTTQISSTPHLTLTTRFYRYFLDRGKVRRHR